ncbi:hypothetical protein BBD41_03220 [Paenibacillus ihbetae]|uniref:DUF3800 domain-containing protein n=1 Tax=Paenibacillus ihbetae TaxID=1870820 RepID=A0A1B2DVC0_9BACL|nr:DUF3800 domain-containing protein [Paenibacillus ihbetae]ANY71670.1 hypothetical protein BBD41_03220 [Paenibacillus ihbetae]
MDTKETEDSSIKPESTDEKKKPTSNRITKAERTQREIDRLNTALATGKLDTLISRVAYILNNFKESRNSDMVLKLKYWEIFQGFKGNVVDVNQMFKLERDTSIARARAKIQNEYKLFQADDKIRWFRKSSEEIEKEQQIANKPGNPVVSIYADESGKNDTYLIIGGLWVLVPERVRSLEAHFSQWRRDRADRNLPKEFHFTEMKKHQLEMYKEIFTELVSLSDMISLKAVVTERSKSRSKSIDNLVYSLYYQHVHHGIEHEVSTGRVTLPRSINFWKDMEEGTDAVFLAELKQHMVTNFEGYFKDSLVLSTFSPISSISSILIQLADLYTGSINRILNPPKENTRNHKDEFAEFVFDILKLDKSNFKNQEQDMAMIHFLEIETTEYNANSDDLEP